MTRDKIIEATIENFAEYGYQGTSMRKIAEKVGIKTASIYYFFANKQELFIQSIRVILQHHFANMKAAYENHESEQISPLFSELFNRIVFHHTQHEEETKGYIMMVTSPIPDIKQEVRVYLEKYDSWLVDHLTQVIRQRYPDLHESEIEAIIDYFIFIGNGLFWGVIIYDRETIDKNLKQAVTLMNQCLSHVIGSEKDGR
ncbi:TetR/AcrR family transcriptional regulator [Lentibacillus salicampi]|uniref:TetR/AcrR family transcriptional regulator n=1 Tax=Lentibacillus salicampi TaxID=175306 RepID=A0A4Y9ACV4_9BACI|nr:TetR/AcrR family transcriptional regulator [Lentibacillus salicampi]TFJ92201.1 TetR/AcrR family transcriptional regulator [Lentibacillus salicampi]